MSLTLDQALARVPMWKNTQVLQPIPLTGGITNRNYRVEVNGESFVLRMSGENTELLGIHRPTENIANRAAAALGIAPEVIYFIEPEGYLVTRFIEGAPIPVETMGEENWLTQIAHTLNLFHTQGPTLENTFDIFEVIASLTNIGREHNCTFPENFDWLMNKVRLVESALARELYTPRPCHNDLLNANFLNANGKLVVLDWEYAGMGDIYFDLANFSHHHSLNNEQVHYFLNSYFGTSSEKYFARLKIMEPLSDIREALWGTVQTGISTLDEDFVGYANQWYTRAKDAFNDERFNTWLKIVSM
jgi:thiamine kinase-like enzyme